MTNSADNTASWSWCSEQFPRGPHDDGLRPLKPWAKIIPPFSGSRQHKLLQAKENNSFCHTLCRGGELIRNSVIWRGWNVTSPQLIYLRTSLALLRASSIPGLTYLWPWCQFFGMYGKSTSLKIKGLRMLLIAPEAHYGGVPALLCLSVCFSRHILTMYPCWPGTCYGNQTDHKLPELPASVSC